MEREVRETQTYRMGKDSRREGTVTPQSGDNYMPYLTSSHAPIWSSVSRKAGMICPSWVGPTFSFCEQTEISHMVQLMGG